MGDVVEFVRKIAPPQAEEENLDLITVIDVAIRDLRDISQLCGPGAAARQADACRGMLEQAFSVACREA